MKFARWLFFSTLTLSLATETLPPAYDSAAWIGTLLHLDIKTLTRLPLSFSIIELCLIVCAALYLLLGRTEKKRHPYQTGQLLAPVLVFAGAIAFEVLYGLQSGGNMTFALFEVRGLGILIFAYFLVGMMARDERDLNRIVWCVLIACTWLAIENTLRYFILLHGKDPGDLDFDHDDVIVLCFGVVVCGGLLVFRGTRWQRRWALALMPLLIYCMMLMHRRAAFAALPVGIVVLIIVLYRLRPKLFWRVAPPLFVLVAIYLGIFWNNQGSWGQPARAIRSQISPDPRDASSDQYRLTEKADILANIQSSRYLGLGFGQQYIFYYPLPDLSFWPFWHYTSHNAVLWVWMDGGIPAFFSFFLLLGSGAYWGSQELASRREAWSLAQLRLRLPRGKRRRMGRDLPVRASRALATPAAVNTLDPASPATAAAMPPWTLPERRSHSSPGHVGGGPIALLTAGVALVMMQITFSYVDLGLTSGRLMLLLGVLLGVMGRKYVSAGTRKRRKLGVSAAAPPSLAPNGTSAAEASLDTAGVSAQAQPVGDAARSRVLSASRSARRAHPTGA